MRLEACAIGSKRGAFSHLFSRLFAFFADSLHCALSVSRLIPKRVNSYVPAKYTVKWRKTGILGVRVSTKSPDFGNNESGETSYIYQQ